MDNNQVNFWLSVNAVNFNPVDLPAIKAQLEQMNNNQVMLLQSAEFKKPSTIFMIALLLGWERFLLDDIGLGIVKVITAYGCGIWWLIDVISAKKRAQKYNFQQFQKATSAFGGGNINSFVAAPAGSNQPVSYQTENNNSAQSTPQHFSVPVNQPQGDTGLMQNLFNRVKQLLINPRAEFQTIEKENPLHTKVLTHYVLLLMIIPFLFSFIGGAVFFGSYSFGSIMVAGARFAFCQLFLLFGGIYITSLIINAMASKFGGQKDFNRTFSLVAYAYIPMFLAGIFHIWYGLSWIVFSVGAYGLYLLITGLKTMTKPTEEKVDSYAAISFIIAVVIYAVLWKVLSLIMLPSLDLLSFSYSYY